MKKKTILRLAFVLIFSMMLFTVAFAAEESSAYIGATNGYITFSGDDVNVYFSIVGRHIMNEIGVSEILLFEQNGNTWTRVCTFKATNPAYTADMLSYNTSAKADHVTYPDGDSSKNYYAILYFYAADDDGSDTIPYIT